ncbi:MAG: septal ring lytic transglycosylase RlpA family protein [Hyphomicrobiales bacterium]|nr:septal ring lytic transglycosylase RlpA family protein [Hyphomicrobiales bacterium]MBV8428288.1 septal ring lytic transglycosylase RlpA family protein [Hyphomicrobiales bacterium]
MRCVAPARSGRPNSDNDGSRGGGSLDHGSRAAIRLQSPWRFLVGVGVSLLLANCAAKTNVGDNGIDPKLGVRASPRLYSEGEEIPKGGGKRLVGDRYTVAGQIYVPQEVKRYSVVGLASWYGTAFHGRLTANGEVFDRYSISAAHKTLPIPSYARVTNIRNGRSIVVRINDRGPYHANRVMDVSERVAEVLDFKSIGTTQIRLDYLRPASLGGSDDRKLLATLRTDGSGAVLDGPGSVPVALASADLPEARASGPGAPIAAIASAVSAAASPLTQGTTSVAYSEPAPRPSLFGRSGPASTGAGQAPTIDAIVAQASDDGDEAAPTTTIVRNDALARTTVAYAPLPPERPYELGTTTLMKSSSAAFSKPAAVDDDDDEVIAPRPPARPKQLATLFFAPERLSNSQDVIKGNPFAGLKPQTFVRLQAP